jgi:hypothetical protein
MKSMVRVFIKPAVLLLLIGIATGCENVRPILNVGVMARSGVLTSGSSGDQIDLSYLDTVFELYSSYHLGQIVEAA